MAGDEWRRRPPPTRARGSEGGGQGQEGLGWQPQAYQLGSVNGSPHIHQESKGQGRGGQGRQATHSCTQGQAAVSQHRGRGAGANILLQGLTNCLWSLGTAQMAGNLARILPRALGHGMW